MKHLKMVCIFLTVLMWVNAACASAGPLHDHTRAYQKPGASVYIESRGLYQLMTGDEKYIEIKLQSSIKQGNATVSIKVDDNLLQLSDQTQWDFELSENHELTIPVSVLAQYDGRFFIHIFTTIEDHTGRITSRAQAVAVDVGDQKKAKQFKSTGQEYIVLPANEEIL